MSWVQHCGLPASGSGPGRVTNVTIGQQAWRAWSEEEEAMAPSSLAWVAHVSESAGQSMAAYPGLVA